jgi:integrase
MAIGDVTVRTVRRRDGTSYEIYQGEYRDRDGKRAFVSDRKKHEAQHKLREAIKEVAEGIHAKGRETLGEVIDEYIYDREKAARRGDITNQAVATDKYVLLKLLPMRLRAMKITDFKDVGLIKESLLALRDSGKAVNTVDLLKQALKQVFGFAMESPRCYVARNVMKDHPFSVGKRPKRTNKAFKDEAAVVLRAAKERIMRPQKDFLTSVNLYAILCMIVLTGVRPEEAGGLQVTDIRRFDCPPPDSPTVWGLITIRHTNTVRDKFREKTKNGVVRVLPMGKATSDALDLVERAWQARRHADTAAAKWNGPDSKRAGHSKRARRFFTTSPSALERRRNGFVFISAYGRPYNSNSIGQLVNALVKEVGIVRRDAEGRILINEKGRPLARISSYSFRHMVATHNAGSLPTHIGAAITGHSEKTYLGAYVHLDPTDQRRIAQSLGDLESEVLGGVATNLQQRLISG